MIIALFSIALLAKGNINIDWSAAAGFFFNADPSIGILGDGTGNATVAYLVYSTDQAVGPFDPSGTFLDGDIVLQSVAVTEDGIANDDVLYDSYAWFVGQNYTATYTAGYVYGLILQDNVYNMGDWYYYTVPVWIEDITGITPPQHLEMNTDLLNGNAIDFGPTVSQVIPEPATLGLFGLGALGAWVLRRSKSQK